MGSVWNGSLAGRTLSRLLEIFFKIECPSCKAALDVRFYENGGAQKVAVVRSEVPV